MNMREIVVKLFGSLIELWRVVKHEFTMPPIDRHWIDDADIENSAESVEEKQQEESTVSENRESDDNMITFENSRKKTYILHMRSIKKADGGTRPIYFFSNKDKSGRDMTELVTVLPEGKEIHETKNGLPVLRNVSTEESPVAA